MATTVDAWLVARWRPTKVPHERKRRQLTTARALGFLPRAPALLKEEERADLERVWQADQLLADGSALVQHLRQALHELNVAAFVQWLNDATASDLNPFARLGLCCVDLLLHSQRLARDRQRRMPNTRRLFASPRLAFSGDARPITGAQPSS